MIAERPDWTDNQIAEVQPHFERAREAVKMYFNEWLARQEPRGDTPDAVGDFKHRMVRLVGKSLKRIGLEELSLQVETRTAAVTRQAETIADARQLLRDVKLWLTSHGDATRIVRVADLRALLEVGKEYAVKLRGMAERITLADIGTVRMQLASFVETLKNAEAGAVKRADALWQSKLRSEEDIERLSAEVESLVSIFENLPKDQKDILLMRQALRMYQKDYQQLIDERLTWVEFEKLSEQLQQDAGSTFVEKDLPWTPKEVIGGFVVTITKQRKEASGVWIEALEAESTGVASMSAGDANRLHARAENPPAVLTEPHVNRLKKLIKNIEARLDALKIDWLVERYNELSPTLQKKFIGLITAERKSL